MRDKSKPEFYTSERCFIRELLNTPAWPDVSIARCRVEPGVTTQLHKLSVMEWYVVEQGSGDLRVGEAELQTVTPGDAAMIPAGTAQQITNHGATDLVFLCVCTPRFTTDCYESLEAD